MGKKNKKQKTVEVLKYGTPVGFKHLGKPVCVALGVYDLDVIESVFVENSEEFNFTGLTDCPVLVDDLTDTDKVSVLLGTADESKALCVFVFTHQSQVVEVNGGIVLKSDLLPFRVGDSRTWRDPKRGYLLEDSEETLQAHQQLLEQYKTLLPGWGGYYTVEQVVNPAGYSDSVDALIHKQVLSLLNSDV